MTILWKGGEIDDFPTRSGTISYYGSGGANPFRTGYARDAILFNATSWVVTPQLPAPLTTIGACCYMYRGSGTWLSAKKVMGFRGGGSSKLAIRGSASGYLVLGKWDGASETVLATSTEIPATLGRIDMWIEGYGATARVRVWSESSLLIDYTGDITIPACTGYDEVWWGNPDNGPYVCLSECIVADEITTRLCLVTIYPTGAGDANDLDGGLYSDVDEIACNWADCLWSGTADQRALFAASNLPAGSYTIRDLTVVATAARGASGPANLALGVKSGSENFGTDQSLGLAYGAVSRAMPVNPVTSTVWTQAAVNAVQIGAKSRT